MSFQPYQSNMQQGMQQMQQQMQPYQSNMQQGMQQMQQQMQQNPYGSSVGAAKYGGNMAQMMQQPGMQQTPGGQQMPGNMPQAWRPAVPQHWQNNPNFQFGNQPGGQQQQQQQQQQQPQRPPPAQRLMNPTDRQQGRLDYLKSQGRESQNNFAQAKDPYGQVNPRQQQRLDYLQSQGREPGANFGRMGNGSKMRIRARRAKGQGGQGIMSQPPMMEGA